MVEVETIGLSRFQSWVHIALPKELWLEGIPVMEVRGSCLCFDFAANCVWHFSSCPVSAFSMRNGLHSSLTPMRLSGSHGGAKRDSGCSTTVASTRSQHPGSGSEDAELVIFLPFSRYVTCLEQDMH